MYLSVLSLSKNELKSILLLTVKLNGKGTPSEIACVMFGTKNPTSTQKRKVRNICQSNDLANDKKRAISIGENKYLLLTKNANGREKNLYHIANSDKEAKAIAKQG